MQVGEKDGPCGSLAVDVGNTSTRLGLFAPDAARDAEPVGTFEVTTPERLTADEARLLVERALEVLGRDAGAAAASTGRVGAILSCVVPSLTEPWTRGLTVACGTRPLVVGPGLKTGIRMDYHDPSEVGPDRIADAVAARESLGCPAIAVDLGTTVNMEVVDDRGTFVGGVIAPGLALGMRALAGAAARLPQIELKVPTRVIGKSTREAMLSGVVLGEAIRIDGLVRGIERELGSEAPVVMCGDGAQVIAGLLQHPATVDPTLTLRGLHLLYLMNARQQKTGPRATKTRR